MYWLTYILTEAYPSDRKYDRKGLKEYYAFASPSGKYCVEAVRK